MDNEVFYLTKERQGLYIGNKLIKTVEEVQNDTGQLNIFDYESHEREKQSKNEKNNIGG